jgi:hypothetical protein
MIMDSGLGPGMTRSLHIRQIQRPIDQRAGAFEIEIAVEVLLRRE